ncbi:MAG: hypothetical protein ABEJ02_03565 [Candidatus Paceibacteria bacterium]
MNRKEDITIPIKDTNGFVKREVELEYLDDPSSGDYELIGKAYGTSVAHCVYLARKFEDDFLDQVCGYNFKFRWEDTEEKSGAEEAVAENKDAEMKVCFYKKKD